MDLQSTIRFIRLTSPTLAETIGYLNDKKDESRPSSVNRSSSKGIRYSRVMRGSKGMTEDETPKLCDIIQLLPETEHYIKSAEYQINSSRMS